VPRGPWRGALHGLPGAAFSLGAASAARESGDSVVITDSGGNTLTVANVLKTSLVADG
jgi:hypothetical protein